MNENKTVHKIGLATATIVGINAMIGAGIFSVPSALAANVGPAGILTFAFVIVAVWFMARSMARLAELYPQEGSFYIYAKQWGGHAAGIIAISAYLIGLCIAMGLLTQMAGSYVHKLIPSLSAFEWSTITLSILVLFNIIGATLSQAGQIILVCCTIFPLMATIGICLSHANSANLTPFMPYGLTNVFAATRAVIFGFFGFESAASLYNVVKNPKQNVPKALTYSIVIVGTLYLLFAASLILAIPLHYFSDPSVPLSTILKSMFPQNQWLITIIHISILSAIIGTVHSMIWGSSELLVSYVKQLKSSFFKNIITQKILSQRKAVFIIGLCIFITSSTLKKLDLFFSLTATFLIVAFTMSIITLLTLPKSQRTTGQTVTAVFGLVTAAIIFYFSLEGLVTELFKI